MSKIYVCIKTNIESENNEVSDAKFGSKQITIHEYLKLNPLILGVKYEEVEVSEYIWGKRDKTLWIWIRCEDEKCINVNGKKYISDATLFPRELFIDLSEWREQQINSILND
jgi:hypothetical protein